MSSLAKRFSWCGTAVLCATEWAGSAVAILLELYASYLEQPA